MRRFAWSVVALTLVAAAAAGVYAVRAVAIDTNTVDMLSAELPFRKADRAMAAAFPRSVETIVVVIDAESPERADAAGTALAEGFRARPEVFGASVRSSRRRLLPPQRPAVPRPWPAHGRGRSARRRPAVHRQSRRRSQPARAVLRVGAGGGERRRGGRRRHAHRIRARCHRPSGRSGSDGPAGAAVVAGADVRRRAGRPATAAHHRPQPAARLRLAAASCRRHRRHPGPGRRPWPRRRARGQGPAHGRRGARRRGAEERRPRRHDADPDLVRRRRPPRLSLLPRPQAVLSGAGDGADRPGLHRRRGHRPRRHPEPAVGGVLRPVHRPRRRFRHPLHAALQGGARPRPRSRSGARPRRHGRRRGVDALCALRRHRLLRLPADRLRRPGRARPDRRRRHGDRACGKP